jgi:hypothetical protein
MKNKIYDLKGKKADAFADLPQGYFDNLQKSIDSRIEAIDSRPVKHYRLAVGIAAALVFLLASGAIFFIREFENKTVQTAELNHFKDSIQKTKIVDNKAVLVPKDSNLKRNDMEYKTNTMINSDSLQLMLDELQLDEIMLYLIEKEEFEF